jgi:hypothetical protein
VPYYFFMQRPVIVVPAAHDGPSGAPAEQTTETSTSSSRQATVFCSPVTTRNAGLDAPTGPGGPWGPGSPFGPAGPAAPADPVGPGGPAGPRSPFDPAGPAAPADPIGPGGPAAPCCPSGPAWPCGPCGPEQDASTRLSRATARHMAFISASSTLSSWDWNDKKIWSEWQARLHY